MPRAYSQVYLFGWNAHSQCGKACKSAADETVPCSLQVRSLGVGNGSCWRLNPDMCQQEEESALLRDAVGFAGGSYHSAVVTSQGDVLTWGATEVHHGANSMFPTYTVNTSCISGGCFGEANPCWG